MSLFKVFKKKEQKVIDTIDKSDWMQVFSACLGKMMVIQNNASEYVVKNRNWNVDFGKGVIAFGEDEYPVQFIGSESNKSNTWNWAWNNVNHFDESIIQFALETYKVGMEYSLDPLRVAQFELNDVLNGHNLSIVACGLSDKNYFYYRGPHEGGAILMAVGNIPNEVFIPINIQEFVNLTIECINQFPVDHKIFVEALLEWNNTSFIWKENVLIAHFTQDLYITFEQSNKYYRISTMNTKQ